MAAVEKLMKHVGDGSRVSVQNARMGMPVVADLRRGGDQLSCLG